MKRFEFFLCVTEYTAVWTNTNKSQFLVVLLGLNYCKLSLNKTTIFFMLLFLLMPNTDKLKSKYFVSKKNEELHYQYIFKYNIYKHIKYYNRV